MINKIVFKKVKIDKNKLLFFTFLFSLIFSNDFDRCIWVKAETLKEKKTIYDALTFASDYGFDKVFLQVRSRGDSYYNSNIVPKNHLVENSFDPLDYAIKVGRSLNLEIHAWVNTYVLWSSPNKPAHERHLYYTNPDWMEVNVHGKSDSSIDISLPQSLNWEGIYLSPNNPEVNNYLSTVFYELIDNYNIDGIHFDYIRFQDDIYGYNKAGRNLFENVHKFDPFDIERNIISTKYGWTISEIDSMKQIWANYKINNINNLLYRIKTHVDRLDKNVQISAAVKANPIISKKKWSQDWKFWINEGLVDFVVTMNYDSDYINFIKNIDIIKKDFYKTDFNDDGLVNNLDFSISKDIFRNKIVMGIAIYNQDALKVSNKIYFSYYNNFKGISLFPYDVNKDTTYWFNDLLDVFQIIE